MSYSAVIAGLKTVLATVPGLPQLDASGNVVNILDYEPTSIQTTPTLYMILDSFEGTQLPSMTYRIRLRACFKWQDNEFAEEELMPFVNSISKAIDNDPWLAGMMDRGGASVPDGDALYVTIGGTLYRCLDTFVSVYDKDPFGV